MHTRTRRVFVSAALSSYPIRSMHIMPLWSPHNNPCVSLRSPFRHFVGLLFPPTFSNVHCMHKCRGDAVRCAERPDPVPALCRLHPRDVAGSNRGNTLHMYPRRQVLDPYFYNIYIPPSLENYTRSRQIRSRSDMLYASKGSIFSRNGTCWILGLFQFQVYTYTLKGSVMPACSTNHNKTYGSM